LEDRAICAAGERGSAGTDEEAAIWSGAVLLDVAAEQRDEFGVTGTGRISLMPGA